jgi:hypothetical protein
MYKVESRISIIEDEMKDRKWLYENE